MPEDPDRKDFAAQRSDEALFADFRAGDERALKSLMQRYERPLRELVRRQLPGPVQRRISDGDVVQETWLAVVHAGSRFEDRGPTSFRNWLFGIASNKAKQAVRGQGAQRRATGREISRLYRPDTAQFVNGQPSPSQVAMADELADRIRRALETLTGDYREVLHLTRRLGLTLREAAERMGRSREATKKLYGRAFVRFKQAFATLDSIDVD